MSVIGALLGRPLANREFKDRQIGVFEGVPAMGLDALGSSAYGPRKRRWRSLFRWRCRHLLHRLRDGADPGAARHSLRLLSTDDSRLSQQRRRLHGFQGKPRRERQPSRRRGFDGRLRAQRRSRDIGGRGRPRFGGVEAVSNGVGAFREPHVKHAQRTLGAIVDAQRRASPLQSMS